MAICEEGQVDVNSASLEKLQTFTGIGPVKAQAIIDYRQTQAFKTVDDLINVYGIGETTLNNMKNQGACVSSEEKSEEEPADESPAEVFPQINEEKNEIKQEETTIATQAINLNPKESEDIKNAENSENLNRHALYGLFGFAVLLGFLYLAKFGRKKKNEFME